MKSYSIAIHSTKAKHEQTYYWYKNFFHKKNPKKNLYLDSLGYKLFSKILYKSQYDIFDKYKPQEGAGGAHFERFFK